METRGRISEGIRGAGIVIKDAIADITLQQVLTRPTDFDVIATLNLNGDYKPAPNHDQGLSASGAFGLGMLQVNGRLMPLGKLIVAEYTTQ